MTYKTEIQAFEGYIRVEVSGARMPGKVVADAVSVGQKITDACHDTGVNKVLLISRMTGRLLPTEAYEIFSDPLEYGWGREIRLAFVDMNEESKDDTLFSETVAVNRAYQMSVFDTEDDAMDWLLESSGVLGRQDN